LHRVLQWHPRATFISLSDSPQTTKDEKSRDGLLDLGNADDGKKRRAVGIGAIQERRKQTLRQPSPYNDGDLLEALFEESLKQPAPGPNETPRPITTVEPYIHADTLRKMLADKSCLVGDSWKFFVEHFSAETWSKGSIDQRTLPKTLHSLRNALISRLIAAKREDPFSLDLPTVTEFSRVCAPLGRLRCNDWVELMLVLLENLIKLDPSLPKDSVRADRIMSDVVGAWNVVFRPFHNAQDYPSDGSPLDWSNIPKSFPNLASLAYRKSGTRGLFALFAPMFPFRLQYNMATVAVATFALLTKDSILDKAVVREASPLVSALGSAISIHGPDVGRFDDHPEVPSSVAEFLRESASKTKEVACNMQPALTTPEAGPQLSFESRPTPKFKSMSDRSLSSSIRTDIGSITKRLYDAMQRRDAPQVDKLWSDALHFPVVKSSLDTNVNDTSEPVNKRRRGTLTADLCNYFIMIYMTLRQPTRAIEVWNHMVRSGLTPDLKTWDSMMNGCKACRDHKALEDVWMKMQNLRVEPDVVCWTTRISGLIECHQVNKALHALDEMGRLWIASNKNDVEPPQKKGSKKASVVQPARKAVKPTIHTVNAAIAGLLRKRQPEAAHRVLAWAGKFDIRPNVITYNTLLTPLVRDGHSKEAMELLKQMQKDGIEADVGTFTTILDETFRYSDELTPEEQKAITENIFFEMESVGIKANLHTYGKMIYQLLQGASGDMQVVNAVLEHMAAQDITPTAYINTMLVGHYFTREPPDLDAVRHLVERGRMDVGSVDHIFWDRVIEGYARVGDTAAAMRILGGLETTGNRPSWVTCQTLLTALVENEEWAIAKSFVGNIKADTGGPRPDHEMKGKEGQQRFWRLAAELELL
jgi:pentatricopeptide repeat protein